MIGLKTGTASNLKIPESSVPFSVDELLDDNEEDDNLMMEEFIKRKHKAGFVSAKWEEKTLHARTESNQRRKKNQNNSCFCAKLNYDKYLQIILRSSNVWFVS